MEYIKSLKIKGYKKFQDFQITFNPGLNILIGENSAGKSTILEAIEIVLNHSYFNYGAENYQQRLNIDNVQRFLEHSDHTIGNLPTIEIEATLQLEKTLKNSFFYGQQYGDFKANQESRFGIFFKYEFDRDFETEFFNMDFSNPSSQIIPLVYYRSQWTTFSGNAYKRQQNPLKSILIDNSSYMRDAYGSYAKRIYNIQIDDNIQRKVSHEFNKAIKTVLDNNSNDLSIGQQRFTTDERRTQLKDLIDIEEDNISIHNMGRGKESLIKTKLSLDTQAKLVMIEEPENHLSYSNTRKQIADIKARVGKVNQIILTTHESMILNRLNLQRAIWIQENEGIGLVNLPPRDVTFFERNDDFDILKFILGKNIILVEGASEYIVMPSFVKQKFQKDVDELGISILSLHGVHYDHFIELAKQLKKKTLILTDNDGSKVDQISKLNEKLKKYLIRIETPSDPCEFTFEVALYNKNQSIFEQFLPSNARTTKYKDHDYLPVSLAYSLAHKTDTAIKISDLIENDKSIIHLPEYIERGLKWLVQSN